jgi:O-antigen/teichoic acid export membrane protein
VFVYKSFTLWIVFELLGNALTYIIINRNVTRKYSWLNVKMEKSYRTLLKENKDVLRNLKNIVLHRFSGIITTQTDSIIISIFATARDIALYANYLLIINGITNLLTQFFNGLTASIGNLIAEGNNNKSYKIFLQLYHLEFYIGVCVSYVMYRIINPFIEVWIGKEYLFSNVFVLIICVNFFIQITRRTVDFFKDGYGIFYDYYAPLIQAAINLGVSLILGKYYGIIGVYIGTFVSSLPLLVFWRPIILFKRGFQIKTSNYLRNLLKLLVLSGVAILISEQMQSFVNIPLNSWIGLVSYFIITSLIISLTLFILFIPIHSFNTMIKRLIQEFFKITNIRRKAKV